MIRFLNLKDQITDGIPHFAFFHTVSNGIMSFGVNYQQVFDSWPEFLEAFNERNNEFELDRFSMLVPLDYIEDDNFTKGISIFEKI